MHTAADSLNPLRWHFMLMALTACVVPPEPALPGPARVHLAPKSCSS